MNVIDIAKEVLEIEQSALKSLSNKISDDFEKACKIILNCKGKVVVTGIGKSGIVGQKISATLASTGTPAFFMHPAEGSHGDLGVLSANDVAIAISNSGESEELIKILPVIKKMGLKLIVMTGGKKSSMSKFADVLLDISVDKEACPFNLAPTASTTVTMALGDALAVSLIKMRGFKKEDFALRHPGGRLGRRLLLKVADLMHSGDAIPMIAESAMLKEVIMEITSKKLGVTTVLDENKNLKGIITDGDLRRSLEKYANIMKKKAKDIMTMNPKYVFKNDLAVLALQTMEDYKITSLVVFDNEKNKKLAGIIHLHDLLKSGI